MMAVRLSKSSAVASLILIIGVGAATSAHAANTPGQPTSELIRIAALLTALGFIPAFAICMTGFVRIAVVLSMIRHGLGMPETPPNAVLVSLAILITGFVMAPTMTAINKDALGPFLDGAIPLEKALDLGAQPLRRFMLAQVHDQDLKAVYDISHQPLPASAAEVDTTHLTLAYMLNELRVAFRIGFVVLLPFLLIDLVVTAVLMSLGMLMVPPTTIALPIKVLMFVLVDGWSLIVTGLAGSFH